MLCMNEKQFHLNFNPNLVFTNEAFIEKEFYDPETECIRKVSLKRVKTFEEKAISELKKAENVKNATASRYKRIITETLKNNEVTTFLTYTFNDSIDRCDPVETVKAHNKIITNLRQNYKSDLFYCGVREEHKEGGYHFHLFTNITVDKSIESEYNILFNKYFTRLFELAILTNKKTKEKYKSTFLYDLNFNYLNLFLKKDDLLNDEFLLKTKDKNISISKVRFNSKTKTYHYYYTINSIHKNYGFNSITTFNSENKHQIKNYIMKYVMKDFEKETNQNIKRLFISKNRNKTIINNHNLDESLNNFNEKLNNDEFINIISKTEISIKVDENKNVYKTIDKTKKYTDFSTMRNSFESLKKRILKYDFKVTGYEEKDNKIFFSYKNENVFFNYIYIFNNDDLNNKITIDYLVKTDFSINIETDKLNHLFLISHIQKNYNYIDYLE